MEVQNGENIPASQQLQDVYTRNLKRCPLTSFIQDPIALLGWFYEQKIEIVCQDEPNGLKHLHERIVSNATAHTGQ